MQMAFAFFDGSIFDFAYHDRAITLEITIAVDAKAWSITAYEVISIDTQKSARQETCYG